MITFMVENFSEAYEEAKPLLQKHYTEISTHKYHGVPLEPQLSAYKAREQEGSLVVLVGREAGAIVAYTSCFVAPGLHYKSCLTCTPDIFFVHPDKRKSGLGVKMFRALETELKRRGVRRWAVGCKVDHDASALFRYLGFKPVEMMFEKWFEE